MSFSSTTRVMDLPFIPATAGIQGPQPVTLGPRNGVPATAKARLRASVTRYASRGAPRGDERIGVVRSQRACRARRSV